MKQGRPGAVVASPASTAYRSAHEDHFCRGELAVGGAERQLVALARGLAALGHRVTIAAFRPGGPVEQEALGHGLEVLHLGGGSPLRLARALLRLVGRERPDVVHGYLTAGNLVAAAARLARPAPLLVMGARASDMRMAEYALKWRAAALAERHAMRLADLVIVNSQAGRRVLEAGGLAPGRIETVDNGIDLDRFAPDAADRERLRAEWEAGDRTVIGHVGRIDPMKDHATFLAALARLKAGGAAFKAVVVAVGEESGARGSGRRGRRSACRRTTCWSWARSATRRGSTAASTCSAPPPPSGRASAT